MSYWFVERFKLRDYDPPHPIHVLGQLRCQIELVLGKPLHHPGEFAHAHLRLGHKPL